METEILKIKAVHFCKGTWS